MGRVAFDTMSLSRKLRWTVLTAGLAGAVQFAPHFCIVAQAQVSSREGIDLQNQIMELRQQLTQLQGSGQATGGTLPPPVAVGSPAGTTGAGNGDLVAQLLDRVSSLEDQEREMHGQIEELTNQVKEQNAALSKQMGDLQFAMQNGGKIAPSAAPATSAAKDTEDTKHAETASGSKSMTPDEHLKAGNADLLHHDYASAQQNAEAALEHGKGAFRVDAQFLLGQSLAGQKQYRQSAVAYYDAYKQSPKSTRAPDALLGVSASLLALGDKKAACQALGKLNSEFPSPAPRVASAAAVFSKRGNCS